jgi:hypothetical protein
MKIEMVKLPQRQHKIQRRGARQNFQGKAGRNDKEVEDNTREDMGKAKTKVDNSRTT